MLEPWAKEVERLSNKQVKITIVPRMGLGGKPKDLIPQATEGKIADMIWTVNTYSGKPFPSSEVFELPFIHRNDPIATNLAMREMFASDLKREYEGFYQKFNSNNMFHTLLYESLVLSLWFY